MSLADNVKDIALSSAYPTDKVFFSESESYTGIPDSVGVKTFYGGRYEVGEFDTLGPCDNTYFVVGIYSFDNGATWHDFNNATSFGTGELYPSFRLEPKVFGPEDPTTDGLIFFQGYQSALVNGGSNWTLLVKDVAIAKKNQGNIRTPILTSNPDLAAYQTDGAYAKIAFDDNFTILAGAGAQTVPIHHNLGYVPDVRLFYEEVSSGITYMRELINGGGLEVKLNENDLVFIIPNLGTTRTFYYRIYYDE